LYKKEKQGATHNSGQTGRLLIHYTGKRESEKHRTRTSAARFNLIKALSFINKINLSLSRRHQTLLTSRRGMIANIFVM
jgi:hypothetical protein